MAITLNQLKPGTRIRVRVRVNGEFNAPITAVIEKIETDTKNGVPDVRFYPEGKPWEARWVSLHQIDHELQPETGDVVFDATFQGDLFRIKVLSNKQYLYEQVAGDDGVIIKTGIVNTLQEALSELYQQINSWAADIDAGCA